MNPVKTFYRTNKAYVLGGLALFVLWRFWAFFSGLFNVLTPGNGPGLLGAVTDGFSNVQASAETSHNKSITRMVAPNATPEFLATCKQTGAALALALKEKGMLANIFSPDKETVYRLIKPYARVLFGVGGKVAVTKGVPHLRNPAFTMLVLQPFYAEETGGRNLRVDLDATFAGSDTMDSFYKQYIRI